MHPHTPHTCSNCFTSPSANSTGVFPSCHTHHTATAVCVCGKFNTFGLHMSQPATNHDRYLTRNGAILDKVDRFNSTPTADAVREGHPDIANFLRHAKPVLIGPDKCREIVALGSADGKKIKVEDILKAIEQIGIPRSDCRVTKALADVGKVHILVKQPNSPTHLARVFLNVVVVMVVVVSFRSSRQRNSNRSMLCQLFVRHCPAN